MMQLDNSYSMDQLQDVARKLEDGKAWHNKENLDEAIQCYLEAYKLARDINNDEVERLCAFNVGAEYVCKGNATEAITYLHKASPPNGGRDGTSNADLFLNFGLCYEKYVPPEIEKALDYFEKAFKECKEHDGNNLDLLNLCYDRCMELYAKSDRHPGAAIRLCQEMANVYAQRNRFVDQAERLLEKAYIIHNEKKNSEEEVSQAIDDTLNVIRTAEPVRNECLTVSKILNDLGLLRTQCKEFERATECFEKANEMLNMSHETGQRRDRLAAVILQNLGASYNFVSDFQRAINFLKLAAEGYGKLKYRNGEGQCFINLAYAYSQIAQNDSDALENTKTYFNHALLAAQTSGDRHMMWQAYEGLGDAFFTSGKITKAMDHYRKAYDQVEVDNNRAKDRLWMKLEFLFKNQPGVGPMKTQEPFGMNGSYSHFAVSPGRQSYNPSPRSQGFSMSMTDMEEDKVIRKEFLPSAAGAQPHMSRIEEHPVRPGAIRKRFVPVRKRDSLGLHLPKVSQGLSSLERYGSMGQMSIRSRSQHSGSQRLQMDSESEPSSENSDEEEEEEEDIEEDDGDDAADVGDQGIVEEIFKKRSESSLGTLPSNPEDLHGAYMAAIQEKENEETARSDDSEVYTDDESTESEDESQAPAVNKENAARRAPPLPTQSPPHTGTYLKPAQRNMHRRSNNDYSNSDDSENQATSTVQNGRDVESDNSDNSTDIDDDDDDDDTTRKDDDPPYATIGTMNRMQTKPVTEVGSDKEEAYPESKVDQMPRGQREQFLMEQHQKRAPPLPQRPQEEKSSKTCVLM
ncbi:uncharacterized protein LOC127876808 isoform X2 [Dreissena polymorpha]|uniref:uncharacterized protein LOC127876808 isoform X2 n=1 Tax=Dreissena polymorpha TaxID=45954 RepID=UPI0022648C26|nr:uncharacterized protein LOC127876808 isoform X2 [Dreissena polymorpha]